MLRSRESVRQDSELRAERPPAEPPLPAETLRKIFRPDDCNGEQSSREIARFVRECGFQPRKPPEPLPPIYPENVALAVWMTVERES